MSTLDHSPITRRGLAGLVLAYAGLPGLHAHGQALSLGGYGEMWVREQAHYLHLSLQLYMQDNATGAWRVLKPPYPVVGGLSGGYEQSQAAADGFLPHDIDRLPSRLEARLGTTAAKLLEEAASVGRVVAGDGSRGEARAIPLTVIQTNEAYRALGRKVIDEHLVTIIVRLFIRDLSGDVPFPPPRGVATVMTSADIIYVRSSQQRIEKRIGPLIDVHTVVRTAAIDWLDGLLDALVARAIRPFVLS